MQFKSGLLFAIIMLLCGNTFAQDKIYKRNGDIIEAKIKNVGVKTIAYLRFDNQSGPEYTIIKNEVEKIVYQNGGEEAFAMRGHPPRMPHHREAKKDDTEDKILYGRSVIAVAPLQFSENGLGIGLSYEHALDPKGIIAFYMPLVATFDLNNSTYYSNSAGAYENGPIDAMYYAMPGIKVYPTGSFGAVRYAIGPSLVVGVGNKSAMTYDPYNGYATGFVKKSHLVLGMIVNNSLNINAGPHVWLGLELGLGFTYLNRVGGLNDGTNGLVQGGFKIGYRF